MRQNSYRKHRHALIHEQFSEDILLNQIFKTIMLDLVQITRIRETKIRLGQALLWLEDLNTVTLDEMIWSRVAFTRLNQQYQVAFEMAKLFCQRSSTNLNSGENRSLSFLVPLNKLFEQYVFKIAQGAAAPAEQVICQGPAKPLAYQAGKPLLQMRPDICIIRNGKPALIIDAKYKELTIENKVPTIAIGDIYQMLAYHVRYHCPRILLVYPAMIDQPCDSPIQSTLTIPTPDGELQLQLMLIDLQKTLADEIEVMQGVLGSDGSGEEV